MAKVVQLKIPKGCRVLVVSDVHAVIPFFEGLLEKVGYGPTDHLILLGDMLEKGPESLRFLRYLMDFAHRRVHFVRGNCDDLVVDFFRADRESDLDFWWYLTSQPNSILWQMGAEVGFTPKGPEELEELRRRLEGPFQREIAFVEGWPIILESKKMVFVHGGVPSTRNMEALSSWRCMKNDDFLNQTTRLDKWVVVGHWPVTLYHPHIPSAKPIIAREKKIISIDGGCALNRSGQLNALILPELDSEDFSWLAYDGNPVRTALDAQKPSGDSVNIRWGRNTLELLEAGEEFSRCRHVESGRELDILTNYLYTGRDGALCCQDATDYRLPVAPGERLGVVRETSRGVLAKKDGVTGWYLGRLAPQIESGVAGLS